MYLVMSVKRENGPNKNFMVHAKMKNLKIVVQLTNSDSPEMLIRIHLKHNPKQQLFCQDTI